MVLKDQWCLFREILALIINLQRMSVGLLCLLPAIVRGQGGTYPPGWDRKPVTWVSLEDARAYAAWAGKRLPHEWEWQYAAQGSDGRLRP